MKINILIIISLLITNTFHAQSDSINEFLIKYNVIIDYRSASKKGNTDTTGTNAFENLKGTFSIPIDNFISFSQTNNNRLTIICKPNAKVLAIAEGKVTGIGYSPENGNIIIIRHGNYLTVYAQLDSVYINKGDKVTQNQILGKIINRDEGKSICEFELWKNQEKIDPKNWFAELSKSDK